MPSLNLLLQAFDGGLFAVGEGGEEPVGIDAAVVADGKAFGVGFGAHARDLAVVDGEGATGTANPGAISVLVLRVIFFGAFTEKELPRETIEVVHDFFIARGEVDQVPFTVLGHGVLVELADEAGFVVYQLFQIEGKAALLEVKAADAFGKMLAAVEEFLFFLALAGGLNGLDNGCHHQA